MRKINKVIALLLSSSAIYGSQETDMMALPIPSLEDAPIVVGFTNVSDSKGKDAIMKAQKAAMMQSGISGYYSKLTGLTLKQIENTSNVAKDKVCYAIDTYTPLKSEHVFFTATALYLYNAKKEITKDLGEPLFKGVHQSVTISQDTYQSNIVIGF